MATLVQDQIERTETPTENVNGEFSTPSGTFSFPVKSAGLFVGDVEISNASSSSGDQFHFEYIKNLDLGIYSHDYGVKLDWDFTVEGPLRYTYQIPFEADFGFPWFVYPGQSIKLTPTFRWHTAGHEPSIEVTHNFAFAHKTSLWCDAPGDGLDDLKICFAQMPWKARLDLEIPPCPGFPSTRIGTDVTIPPFDSGGGEYGGSFTKLGGTGVLKNSGGAIYYEDPTAVTITASPDSTSAAAWKQGHELFELVATILKSIPFPATVAAGNALQIVKDLGEFELKTQIDGSIAREDFVALMVTECSPVQVNRKLKPGDTWKFDLDVDVKYQLIAASDFYYPLGYTATFDMRGIDPKPLAHGDFLWIPAGRATATINERKGVFHISGRLPVIRKGGYPPPVQGPLESLGTVLNRANCITAMKKRGKLADRKDTQTVIRETERISLPKPTGGQPKANQYTLVLGLASNAEASKIAEALNKRGIDAFMVPKQDSNQTGITLGTFADKSGAEGLKEILNGIFKMNSYVSAGIERDAFKPIEEGLLKKLQSK